MDRTILFPPASPSDSWVPTRAQATKFVLWYIGLGLAWFFCFDWLLENIIRDPEQEDVLELINACMAIGVSGVLLRVAMGRYIQAIRRAEQALKASERFAVNTLDSLTAHIAILDHAGRILAVNRAWREFGRQNTSGGQAVALGANYLAICDTATGSDEAFARAFAAGIRSVLAGRETEFCLEYPCHSVNEQRWFMGRVTRFLGEEPLRLVVEHENITPRKDVEMALRDKERLLQSMMNLVPHPIFAKDQNLRHLFANEACAALSGRTPEQIIGLTDAEFMTVSAEAEAFNRDDREVLAGGKRKFIAEERLTTPKGETRIFQTIKIPFEAPGAEAALLGVAVDITDLKHAEEALRQNHLLLTEMGRTAKIGGWSFNPETGEGHWTEEVARIHDLDPALPPNKDMGLSFYPGESRTRIEAAVNLAVEKAIPYDLELEFVTATGSHKWVRTIGQPLVENGKVIKVYGSLQDITERRQAEAALRENEAQFRAMFDTASIGVAQTSPVTDHLVRVNRKMAEITGYSISELLQMRVKDFVHPEDWPHDYALRQQLIKGQTTDYHMEKRYVCKDKRIVWVSVNMTLIRDVNGQPFRTFATVEDITERRKADDERMRLSTALEQAAESIVITNLAGIISYVNPAFERISGYSRRESIGLNPKFLQSGKHEAAFYRKMWGTLQRGEVWRGRFINKRKDGAIFEEEATISPLRNAAGKIDHFMAIKLDVTREVALESQFRQAQKLEAIGQLAGGVAHDFNNILTSILMQVDLNSMEADLSADIREGFQQIRSDAERAASLTRQLLLFSRRQILQARDLDLNEIVTNLAKMLQRIIGEDVRLQLNLHSLPLLTHADAGMLDQLAMNLSVNARDAMPGGGKLVIETSEKMVDEEFAKTNPEAVVGRHVCLSVSDTGTGIPPEVLPRIFEPFFTTKEPGKGTGLGLATVFGIVKQHRGWLTIESELGRGTTFRVFLPAQEAAVVSTHTVFRSRPRRGTETILLVEDEASVRKTTRTILERNGYRVLVAENGPEAVKVWADHQPVPAMLLTDLVMPGGMSGQELARLLMAQKPSLKIIYTSGYSPEIAGKEINLTTGENFVQKPFRAEELLKLVRDCLDG